MEEDSNDLFRRLDYSQPMSEVLHAQPDSSSKNTIKNQNLLQQLQNLNKAKERFKQFLQTLGDLKRKPIRQDIMHYCGDPKKSQKVIEQHIRPETLLKKIDIRIEKMVKTRRIKRNWGQEDLKILVWIISKYCDQHNYTDLEKDITDQDWEVIASFIPGVNPEGCMFKWLSIKKITLSTHKWLEEESQLLEKIVVERMNSSLSDSGAIKDWKQISQELYRLNEDEQKVYRNAKQCKQHWNCHLNPELKKGLWQPDEDIKLLKFIRDNKGLKKWSELSRYFDGRTENALKNRHKLIVQKLQRQGKNKHKGQLQLISEYLQKMMVDQLTSHIKVENDNIYEEISEIKPDCQQILEITPPKKTDYLLDTNDYAITPTRVEKFDFYSLKRMNGDFFRSIQPGRIQSGLFKKINSDQIQNAQFSDFAENMIITKVQKGPFSIIPMSSSFLE